MTLIPIGVIIWVSRRTLVEQAQQQIGTRLKDGVVQVGKSMDEFMFNSIHNIQTMAANPDMSSGDLNMANGDLARLTYSFSFFDQVMLVNPQGVIIASSDSASLGQSVFADFANTRNEFEMAVHARPGSAYVSLTATLNPLNHSADEERFLLLGFSYRARCLVVSHGYRETDSVIRLISARRATKREQAVYWSLK